MAGAAGQEPEEQRPDLDPEQAPGGSTTEDGMIRAYALLGIGFEFLASICLFGALGWWVDRRLNTFPWLTLAGGALGFAAGLTMLIRAARNAFKD